jgi:Domain of unknown function (DUF4397)/Sortase domain
MRLPRPAAASVLAVAALLLAVPGVATAQGGQPTTQVRIAHLSPDASYVDVYAVSLNRDQVFPNVFYKAVSAYWGVAAGAFTYEVRPAGTDPTAPAAVALSGKLQPGRSYTAAVVGPKANLRGLLLSDDLSPVGRGKARVRFVDTLLDRRKIDVVAGGKVLAKGLALGSASAGREVAAGRYRVRAVRAGTGRTLYNGTLTLRAGTVTTAVLTGGAGQPDELFALRDGAGVRDMPSASGGVATGAGGAAPPAPAWPWMAPLLVVGAAGARAGARRLAAGRPERVAAGRAARRSPSLALAGHGAGILLAVLLLAGCAGGSGPAVQSSADRSTSQAPRGAAPAEIGDRAVAAPRSRPSLETSPFPTQVAVPGPPSAPVQLTIGKIVVSTRLVSLGLDAGGALQVPEDFSRAGWFTGGPLPGEQGPAVIAGHVDSRGGPAVFYRLRELRAADIVRVRRADGVSLRFTVDGVHRYPKVAFPKEAVFGTVAQQALRLVTCGGAFDPQRRSYRDNLVVDAHLTGVSRP